MWLSLVLMPDPVVAPWGILFDPDGSKTDGLLHGGGGGEQEVPDPAGPPEGGGGGEWAALHAASGTTDPGGYWEYPNFGGPAIWHSASFSHPGYNPPNAEAFNPEYGNPMPGGG